MKVERTMRGRGARSRRPGMRHTPMVDLLETRQLLSADIQTLAVDGSALTGVETKIDVVGFHENRPDEVASATIDWGDGSTPTAGDIAMAQFHPFLGALGAFGDISGKHTFAKAGTYNVKTTITENIGGATQTKDVASVVTVTDPYITASAGQTLNELTGQAFSGAMVAGFNTNIVVAPDTIKATIDWGDGSDPTAGQIIPAVFFGGTVTMHPTWVAVDPVTGGYNGPGVEDGDGARIDWVPSLNFLVFGGHTYAKAGSYTATVTLDDGSGHTSTVGTPVVAGDNPLLLTGPDKLAITPTAGESTDFHDLARLQDLRQDVTIPGSFDPSSYTATIDWGDGSDPSQGKVDPMAHVPWEHVDHEPMMVDGGKHTFAQAGDYTITITVADKAGDTVTFKTSVTVQGETLSANPADFSTAAGADQKVVVATGTDSALSPSDHLKATIDWGDGSAPTPGDIVGIFDPSLIMARGGPSGGGSFQVVGSHNYATPGTYKVHVTITSDGGATADATSTATVGTFEVVGRSIFMRAGNSIGNSDLARIIVPGKDADPSNYSATIDWGDGTTVVSGTVVAGQPVSASSDGSAFATAVVRSIVDHAYAAAGKYTLKVTVTDQTNHDNPESHTANIDVFVAPKIVPIDPPIVLDPIEKVSGPGIPVASLPGGTTTPPTNLPPVSLPGSGTGSSTSTGGAGSGATAEPAHLSPKAARAMKKALQAAKKAARAQTHLAKAKSVHPHGPKG